MGFHVAPKLLFSKIIPDEGYYDFKGKDVKNINKITCKDYFGRFKGITANSDELRGTLNEHVSETFILGAGDTGHKYGEIFYKVPDVYKSGTIRVTAINAVATTANIDPKNYNFSMAYVMRTRGTVKTDFEIAFKPAHTAIVLYTPDIPILEGDLLSLHIMGQQYGTTSVSPSMSVDGFTMSGTDVEELVVEGGFSWDEWQEST